MEAMRRSSGGGGNERTEAEQHSDAAQADNSDADALGGSEGQRAPSQCQRCKLGSCFRHGAIESQIYSELRWRSVRLSQQTILT